MCDATPWWAWMLAGIGTAYSLSFIVLYFLVEIIPVRIDDE